MDSGTLVLLFLVFGIISSVIRKLQEYRRLPEQTGGQPVLPSEEEEIDLSDWDVFSEPEGPCPEPVEPEFHEVRGQRRVEEPAGGEEFRGVRGARRVDEPPGGVEFTEVRGKRRVAEPSLSAPVSPASTAGLAALTALQPEAPPRQAGRTRRRRRARLDLHPGSLRKAIIYSEVLGPPRAERTLW